MFPQLYSRLKSNLADLLQEEVEYHPGLSLPGFIVWDARTEGVTHCPPHFDSQYRYIDWNSVVGENSPEKHISMTLPIKLPTGGGALRCWGFLTQAELRRAVFGEFFSLLANRNFVDIEYQIGCVALQHDLVVHQPHFDREFSEEDFRIVLQFHGAKSGNRWFLYW